MDNNSCPSAQTPILNGDINTLLSREWIITNNLGGYASSSVINCNTRRYHGMLISATIPPVGRIVTVNNFFERLIIDGREYQLSNFEFNGKIHPEGFVYQSSFQRQIEPDLSNVSFVYQVDNVTFIRTLWLFAEHNTALVYWLAIDSQTVRPLTLAIHPLIALRDFHSLRRQSANAIFETTQKKNSLHIQVPSFSTPNATYEVCLHPMGLRGPIDVEFFPHVDWWYNFRYRMEAQRGQDFGEDLYTPGFFQHSGPGRVGFGLWIDTENLSHRKLDGLLTTVNSHLQSAHGPLTVIDEMASPLAPEPGSTSDNPLSEPIEITLRKAADQFIVRRKDLTGKKRWTILAGYHWFSDWGRDAFFSLPGLLLETGRYEQAKDVLLAFGSAIRNGLIPNRFDDYGGEPQYNSVDASLWYIYAVDEYLRATSDIDSWKKHFQKITLKIIDAFIEGTDFEIKVDSEDGLLRAGDEHTQLTWMDAKCGGVTFTPRWGKPVEVNALWYNALKIALARLDGRKKSKIRQLTELAEKFQINFQKKFWFDEGKYLYDCIRDDYCDAAIRPNQIFAVSLRESPLRPDQQQAVVECVKRELLTPFGLRSLSPRDSRYHGKYTGNQFERDKAYHQGTVWAHLIGPFIEAYLKVNNHSLASATIADDFLAPLLEKHLYEAGIGTISEIFDGDEPHYPRGCIAQAWALASVIHSRIAIKNIINKSTPFQKQLSAKP